MQKYERGKSAKVSSRIQSGLKDASNTYGRRPTTSKRIQSGLLDSSHSRRPTTAKRLQSELPDGSHSRRPTTAKSQKVYRAFYISSASSEKRRKNAENEDSEEVPEETSLPTDSTEDQDESERASRVTSKVEPVEKTTKDSTKKKKEFPKPFRYCSFVARFPWLSFFLAASIHVVTLSVTIGLVVKGYNIFPVDFTGLPLILVEDQTNTRALTHMLKKEYDDQYLRFTNDGSVGTWDRGTIVDTFEVILQTKSGSIFSASNIEILKNIENRVAALSGYSTTCLTLFNGSCDRPGSVLRLFDGTYLSADSSFYATSYENATDILCKAYTNNATSDFVKMYLENSYNPCDASSSPTTTRVFFHLGLAFGDLNIAKSDRLAFLTNHLQPLIEHIANVERKDTHNVYYYSLELFVYDAGLQATTDMFWGAGSFIFIIIVMWVQTGTLWITFMGLYSIITSYLIANIIYRYCFGYIYFGYFHLVAMFIIIGIGADDVFVFYDTWRLTGRNVYPSKAHRLSDFYKSAAKTTFITSLTTTLAFCVTSVSPLLAVRTFGLFSALLVAVNYLFDLIYFPTAVMLYSEKIRPFADPKIIKVYMFLKKYLCRICRKTKNGSDKSEDSTENSSDESAENIGKMNSNKTFADRNQIVIFFKNKFYRLVMSRAARIGIPVFFVVWSIFFIYWATQLETSTGTVQIFVSSHNYDKAYKLHNSGFQRMLDKDYTDVYLMFGMLEQDVSSCDHKNSVFCRGTIRYDQTFDPSTDEAQLAFKNLCATLESMSSTQADNLKIKRKSVTNELDIDCFATEMEAYLQEEEKRAIYGSSVSLDFPLDSGNMTSFMAANPTIYYSSLPAGFNRWFEIGLEYWLSASYSGNSTDDIVTYNDLLGAKQVSGQTVFYNNGITTMAYGTEMKYIVIRIGTTINIQSFAYTEGSPVYNAWETLMATEKEKMPASLKNGYQLTLLAWNWIKVQETLVTYGLWGLGIGLAIALPVLVLTTLNVFIGLIATLTIGLVITCVVGVLPLAGYKLGVVESLNLCMVVGLSVDYVVHLAEAYRSSPRSDRAGRVKSMLESMGLSVASGAITTFGAAAFMLGSKIHLVHQFGVFVMSIISISIFYALFGFTTFMAVCGPQDNRGSLTVLWRKAIAKIRDLKRKYSKGKTQKSAHLEEDNCSTSYPDTEDDFQINNDGKKEYV